MKPVTTVGPPRKKLGRVALRLLGLALIGGLLYGAASLWREKQTDAQLERAESALARRDFAQARSDLQKYLSVRPKDGEAHWLLARTERRSILYDPTTQQWETRVLHHLAESSKAKYDPEALELESALFGAARGELPRVQSNLLRKLGQHHPDSPIILEALIPAYLASHLLPQAMDQVTRLLAIDSENAQAYYWRGLIREQLLFNHLATADFEKALALNPDLEDARRRLARLQLLNKAIEEARAQYDFLVQGHPRDTEALVGLAQCCHSRGMEEEARNWLDQLPPNASQDGPALLLRGQLALEAGHHEEAEALLRQAIAASPYEAQGYYSLARCLRQRGQLAESAVLTARFDRMTADFHRYSALTERMRTESRNPAVLCEAGTIQLRNGMAQNGLGWLASALNADPEYAPAHLALARYYQEAGDHNQAQIHRDRALKALAHSLASWLP